MNRRTIESMGMMDQISTTRGSRPEIVHTLNRLLSKRNKQLIIYVEQVNQNPERPEYDCAIYSPHEPTQPLPISRQVQRETPWKVQHFDVNDEVEFKTNKGTRQGRYGDGMGTVQDVITSSDGRIHYRVRVNKIFRPGWDKRDVLGTVDGFLYEELSPIVSKSKK